MPARKRKFTDADWRAHAKVSALWADFQKKHPRITQEAAAHMADMTQSAFSQFALGRVPIGLSPTLKFARLFGVPPIEVRDDLPDLVYSIKSHRPKREPALGASALEIAQAFTRLQPGTRRLFRKLLLKVSALEDSQQGQARPPAIRVMRIREGSAAERRSGRIDKNRRHSR